MFRRNSIDRLPSFEKDKEKEKSKELNIDSPDKEKRPKDDLDKVFDQRESH